MQNEALGAADRIVSALLGYQDHLYHGRPGAIGPATNRRWVPITHKVEDGLKVVYKLDQVGKKTTHVRIGVLSKDTFAITENRVNVAEYRPAGIYPEVATFLYRQVADVYKLDNEFSARWASYAWGEEYRDLKLILAAFMLVQNRKGDPVLDGDKFAFMDQDFRDVGEAMCLLTRKDGKDLNAKQLLRIYEILTLPSVVAINKELGFGKSNQHAFLGRWPKVVGKWLRYREQNPSMLKGLVRTGFRRTVIELARRVGYKPESESFFETLRWKQSQKADGRRTVAIGKKLTKAESWDGLSEEEICLRISRDRPAFKRLTGYLKEGGITRAIMAAAIEVGSLGNKDLVMYTPTLEDLGLLEVPYIKERWLNALKLAEDTRAANIAKRVRTKETEAALIEAADKAVQKAVEEVTRGLRIYVMVDISGSMTNAIELAKPCIAKLIQAIPLDRIHVSTFNSFGNERIIAHASTAGVNAVFNGIAAGGGTDYGAGIRVLQKHKPLATEDAVFIFIGDEEASHFPDAVRTSGITPIAFGFLRAKPKNPGWDAVTGTAAELGIPCFELDTRTFDDTYAIPRTLRALISATPIGKSTAPRETLAEKIAKTELLKKPAWA